jgi:hypothetical protein
MFNSVYSEIRALYEIMWRNIVGPNRPQMTIWRMRAAFWITQATDTHSEYVKLIAFSRQKWLRERSQCSVIRTLSVL